MEKNSNYILKAKPNILVLGLMLPGTGFFGYWSYMLYSSNYAVNGVTEGSGGIIIFVLFALFTFFSVGCFYCFLRCTIMLLTENELIIKRPLLFYKRAVLLSDINNSNEKDVNINTERGLSLKETKIGHKTLLNINNGKKLEISSLEIWNYNSFIKKLDTQIRINKGRHKP